MSTSRERAYDRPDAGHDLTPVTVDLTLFVRVIWQHRKVVAGGLLLAIVLAILSVAKVSSSGLSYRHAATYQSQATLLVTQNGFPWGRSVINTLPSPSGAQPQYGDPTRFISLAILFSHLGNGDDVRRLMLRDGPIHGTYTAAPIPSDDGNGFIPFISVTAQSDSPDGAKTLARRAATGIEEYISTQQNANKIGSGDRVVLHVVQSATKPTVVAGHKLTTPIAIFLLVMMATLGLAFVLENIRARSYALAMSEDVVLVPDDLPTVPVERARSSV